MVWTIEYLSLGITRRMRDEFPGKLAWSTASAYWRNLRLDLPTLPSYMYVRTWFGSVQIQCNSTQLDPFGGSNKFLNLSQILLPVRLNPTAHIHRDDSTFHLSQALHHLSDVLIIQASR